MHGIVLLIVSFTTLLSCANLDNNACEYGTDCPKEAIEVLSFTEEDIALMERVVMSEASILRNDAKQAVAQTIINRVRSDDYPNTVAEVIEGQYSTAFNGEPGEAEKLAVKYAIECQDAFPIDMFWFRSDYYHPFGEHYVKIQNHYFSTKSKHLYLEEEK